MAAKSKKTAPKGKKSLQKNSLYEQYDLDGDGVVSDAELIAVKAIQEAETQEEKADAQRHMAWVSLIVMIIFTALVFLPIFPDSRINALGSLFATFYIGMAGVVGAYMGMTAYMSAKK
jgi:uncharacterized membrane protein YdjX (TVP38/TMEM64 family)